MPNRPKYAGRCTECGAWNSYVNTVIAAPSANGKAARGMSSVTAAPTLLRDVHSGDHTRIPTGFGEIDRVLGGGIVPGSIALIGGEPGIGKCVSGDTRIFDPITGDYLPITAYADGTHAVLGVDSETHRLSAQGVSAFIEQGTQSVVEVHTRLGHRIVCTPSHPVFTAAGWQSIGDLPPRTRIATPRILPYFGNEVMTEQDIKLIAYTISDGSAQSSISVTTAIPEVAHDLQQLAEHYEMTLRVYEKQGKGKPNRAKDYRFIVPRGQRAQERLAVAEAIQKAHVEHGVTWAEWARAAQVDLAMLRFWQLGETVPSAEELQRLAHALHISISELASEARDRAEKTTKVARVLAKAGLRYSHARNKDVPAPIFRLPSEQLAVFLKTAFSCDGSVYITQNSVPGISYSTISRKLAESLQHLLLRFGFITKLRTKRMTVNDNPYTAFELQMLGVKEVQRFLDEIGIWGREDAKVAIAQMPIPVLPSTHFNTVPTGSAFWDHIQEVSEGASFKELSRRTGVTIHSGRIEQPLSRYTVAAIAQTFPSVYLQRLADSDIYWDEIESMVPAGEVPVYDITVPEASSFVANDLIVHNSTLMLSAAERVGMAEQPTLYLSAEESPQQIKMRADRMGIDGARVALLAETDLDAIIAATLAMVPRLLVIDSIQTIASANVASVPGSISQVRECTLHLMRMAKSSQIPVLLIGHVTKDGTVAGPRALEHIVDAVLYLEGERFHSYRLLRSVKNRFGANEVGIFEMRGEGMVEVADPSGIFLADRTHRATGSAVTVSLEGTRPLLVEVQALASATSYGTPSRTVTGVDHTRLLMLLAVLAKRVGLRLGQHDVYVNVVGALS